MSFPFPYGWMPGSPYSLTRPPEEDGKPTFSPPPTEKESRWVLLLDVNSDPFMHRLLPSSKDLPAYICLGDGGLYKNIVIEGLRTRNYIQMGEPTKRMDECSK